MAKSYKNKKKQESLPPVSMVEEPGVVYRTVKRLPSFTDFSYKKFEKISNKIPFSLKEWANILHLSERTLQRYAKDNKNFEGIYVDRIMQIDQLIQVGLNTFSDADALYEWLKKDKQIMGRIINFNSLSTTQGINDIIDQLGRIQHGVYS